MVVRGVMELIRRSDRKAETRCELGCGDRHDWIKRHVVLRANGRHRTLAKTFQCENAAPLWADEAWARALCRRSYKYTL
eukprot:scaffold20568_cov67-Phaeocystis_antarctica.AAC.3